MGGENAKKRVFWPKICYFTPILGLLARYVDGASGGKDPSRKLPRLIRSLGFDPFGWFWGEIDHIGLGFGFFYPPPNGH